MPDPTIREYGRIEMADGPPLTVGIGADCTVTIGTPGRPGFHRLSGGQAGQFAELFVSACWQAAIQEERKAAGDA